MFFQSGRFTAVTSSSTVYQVLWVISGHRLYQVMGYIRS